AGPPMPNVQSGLSHGRQGTPPTVRDSARAALTRSSAPIAHPRRVHVPPPRPPRPETPHPHQPRLPKHPPPGDQEERDEAQDGLTEPDLPRLPGDAVQVDAVQHVRRHPTLLSRL